MKKQTKNILNNLLKGYHIVMVYDPEEGIDDDWFVCIQEIPGCMSQGNSVENALDMICDAASLWIETAKEEGITIPLPENIY